MKHDTDTVRVQDIQDAEDAAKVAKRKLVKHRWFIPATIALAAIALLLILWGLLG